MHKYLFAIIAALALPSLAAWAGDLGDAITGGNTSLGVRYRWENVDQAGLPETANASTAKARLTWDSAALGAFTFGVEADYVISVGVEDYNSTVNGKTQYPVVADPLGFDLNRAFVKHTAGSTTVTAGRQRILHATQRFVGGVAFRQNEQTFDGVRVQLERDMIAYDYGFIHNVNRIFGPDDGAQPSDWYGGSHILRASFTPSPDDAIGAFAYLLDFHNDNGVWNSNATYGLDYTRVIDRLTINAAVARQSEWGDNPNSYSAGYFAVDGSYTFGTTTLKGGYEVLGSDGGRAAFRTPLATLHKFQGWTDKFLVTPARGVQDLWFSVSGRLEDATLTAAFHQFNAHEGGGNYGSEVAFSLAVPLRDDVSLLAKLAHYSADGYATDTTKSWLMIDWRP